ncbi:MAG: lysophospholipid acyltransferase family protein, partial [Polyangiales bacterium]
VLRIRRKQAIAALRRAGLGGAEVARRAYRSLGTGIFELLWMSGGRSIDGLVRVDGWDRFEAAKARNKGVIVITAHTGNWDLAACACAARTPLAVVTKRLSMRGLDAFWQSSRAARGLELLAAPDGRIYEPVRARLERGGSVALLVDQDPERTTSVIEADFLGETALHDTFAATLAARTGASIVVAFARREGDRHVVEVLDTFTPESRRGRDFVVETTRAIAARLDAFVRAHPDQWLWLHRRWKTKLARLPDQGAQVPRVHLSPGGQSEG